MVRDVKDSRYMQIYESSIVFLDNPAEYKVFRLLQWLFFECGSEPRETRWEKGVGDFDNLECVKDLYQCGSKQRCGV